MRDFAKIANILIIEDDPYEAEHLKLHMQQAGHRIVDVATSGEDALIKAEQADINLILSDIVLSGELDGIETVLKIRKKYDIPAIFLTAHVSDELLLRAEQARPFAYLLKPYRQSEMEFMINMSLTRVQVEKELIAQNHIAEIELRQAHAIIQHTNEGIMVTDTNNLILSVNPAFTRITGYDATEAIGQKTSLLESGKHDRAFYAKIWSSVQRHGHWQGEIWTRRKNGEIFPEWLTINPIYNPDCSLQQFVSIFSDITSIKQSKEELEHLAHHDPLTDLPNRLLFMTRLRFSIRTASRHNLFCAVLYLDLDRFKLVNDSYGHGMGDSVLQTVAHRFKSQIREVDMLARLGGDEFVILLEGIDDPLDISLVAQKIIQSLDTPVIVSGHEFSLSCSIGIAIYPKDGNTVEDLLRDADSAMYQAKKSALNNTVFYSEEMTQDACQRIKLFHELKQALVKHEFELYYQPQVDMHTGTLQGAEALIRWNHPQRGLVGPIDFIKEAEDCGLIIPIGQWVLQEACVMMKTWLEKGIDFGRISVNVAGPQIQNDQLQEVVRQALNQSALKPEHLELELTETYAMELIESYIETLHTLNLMGITIAIDDFGTGASSLSRLKKLHINKLKIDRTFVIDISKDKDDEAIVSTIISMGNSLGLNVIAEGVESEAQKHFLLNEQCLLGQGYLFSKPLNKKDFEVFALSSL